MKFGIWLEPEMCSINSKLHEEHDDWYLGVRSPEQIGRNQVQSVRCTIGVVCVYAKELVVLVMYGRVIWCMHQ